MNTLEVSTVVYLRPAEIYDFLLDFPRYAAHSEYLEEVRRRDDEEGSDPAYDITVSWRSLTCTVRSRVTDLVPPNQIDWRLGQGLEARGYWTVAPEPESAPDLETPASRVRFYVEFAPDSVRALDLPQFASLDWFTDRVKGLVEREARRVVERIVADLEGESRTVDLVVHRAPHSV